MKDNKETDILAGLMGESQVNGPVVIETIQQADKEIWWSIYDAQFSEANKSNPCRQSFYKDEFLDALDNENMMKLAYVKDGEVVTLCLLSNDLGYFPWLSRDYYEERLPKEMEEGNVLYFVALLTKEDHQHQNHASEVIQLLADLCKLANNEPVVIFDCSNETSAFLPIMIETVVENTGQGTIKFDEIGTQRYYEGRLKLN